MKYFICFIAIIIFSCARSARYQWKLEENFKRCQNANIEYTNKITILDSNTVLLKEKIGSLEVESYRLKCTIDSLDYELRMCGKWLVRKR